MSAKTTLVNRTLFVVIVSCSLSGATSLTMSGIANGSSLNSRTTTGTLCKAFPEGIALTVLAGAGSCDESPASSQTPGFILCWYGKEWMAQRYISFSQQRTSEDRSKEIFSAQSQITAWVSIASPRVTQPTGIGQYAITYFGLSGNKHMFWSDWVNGPYVYDLEIWSSSVTQASGLRVTRQIASTTP